MLKKSLFLTKTLLIGLQFIFGCSCDCEIKKEPLLTTCENRKEYMTGEWIAFYKYRYYWNDTLISTLDYKVITSIMDTSILIYYTPTSPQHQYYEYMCPNDSLIMIDHMYPGESFYGHIDSFSFHKITASHNHEHLITNPDTIIIRTESKYTFLR